MIDWYAAPVTRLGHPDAARRLGLRLVELADLADVEYATTHKSEES